MCNFRKFTSHIVNAQQNAKSKTIKVKIKFTSHIVNAQPQSLPNPPAWINSFTSHIVNAQQYGEGLSYSVID